MAYYLDENYTQAINNWQKVLELDQNHTLVKQYLEKIQLPESPAKALPDCTPTARQRIKQESEKHYKKGLVLYRQRNFTEAEHRWNRALKIDPDHVGAQRGLDRINAILSAFEERGI